MSFLVRFVHVGAVSFLLGGALLIALLFLFLRSRPTNDAGDGVLLELVKVYEWAFWAAVAMVVITGLGNLGRFGEGLPEPGSEWGQDLMLKLLLVLAFLMVSLVRTFSVALVMLQDAGSQFESCSSGLARLYWLTAALLGGVLASAVALAHF
jgi:putative copper export protein